MMHLLLTGQDRTGQKSMQGEGNRKPGVSTLEEGGCGGFRKKMNTSTIFNITVRTLTLHLTLMRSITLTEMKFKVEIKS